MVVMILIYMFPVEVLTVSTRDSIPAAAQIVVQNAASAQAEPEAPGVTPVQEAAKPINTTEYNVIGYSFRGNVIHDVIITPADYDRTMLITFAMHGFDGAWDKDGAALVQIANNVIKEFASNREELKTTRLIVVPCVNPDGIWYGQGENGIGRCNGQGIDINRDFDYYWEYSSDSKYHTGNAPFSTPEAQILRSLVLTEKPDIVIDIHGWSNCTYGDIEISDCFNKSFGTNNLTPKSKDKMYMQQHFIGWASQYARAVLVEYPRAVNPQGLIERQYSSKTISSIKEICNIP